MSRKKKKIRLKPTRLAHNDHMLTSLFQTFTTFVHTIYNLYLRAPFKTCETHLKMIRINLSIHAMQHFKTG